ncbi:MAG TPA: exodeoxyribonuclease VII large subunit [Gemmataceae bacterium]|jgi:exodeoxyribonuclease VII large subunit|nr:exodeoxyribonuclease VII large subunit [Gemmataceae bacterium]
MTSLPSNIKVLSVGEVNAAARCVLEDGFPNIWVAGEVSNFTRATSGHLYFTLKEADAELKAVMWRGMAMRLRFAPTAGLHVLARGSLTVYQQKGTFQLVCAELHPQGEGALDLALRQLREKLFARGWFDPKRKKPLPAYPRRVAVVTSPTGAAVRDMLETLRRRWPAIEIILVPVRVQGDGAAEEIAEAINVLNRLRLGDRLSVDILIVGRGGGSLEDLWAFNEEIVARAIFESAIPIVSAVGHETDVTIADLVADHRALTPTHAASHVVPDRAELLAAVHDLKCRLAASVARQLDSARRCLLVLVGRRVLRLPLDRVRERERRMDELKERLGRAGRRRIDHGRDRTDASAGRLEAVSPLNVLARGYSLTQAENGPLVRDAAQVRPGDRVRTRLHRGRLVSRVEVMEFEPE